MAITNLDFEALSERDLIQLKEDQVAEGITLEYKRDAYKPSDHGKRELLKEVTSLVNTAGGHIVIGMTELRGLPTDLIGLDLDIDAEMQRLENLFRTCVEPRIVGLRMRPVTLASGRRVLVMRLPKSWNPPHAVYFKGTRRYFARNSSGAHEASVEELRAMFMASATLFDRIEDFRRRRQVAIHSGRTPVPLKEPQLVLHVVPFSAFGLGPPSIDPPSMSEQMLPPIWHHEYATGYNFDGYVTMNGRDGYLPTTRWAAPPFRLGASSTAQSSRCEAADRRTSWVSVSFIGISVRLATASGTVTTEAPHGRESRRGMIPGASMALYEAATVTLLSRRKSSPFWILLLKAADFDFRM